MVDSTAPPPTMGVDQQLVPKPGTAAPILDDAVPQQVNLVAPLIPVPVQPVVLPALDVAVPQHLNVVAPPLIPIPVPSVSVPQVGAPAPAPHFSKIKWCQWWLQDHQLNR